MNLLGKQTSQNQLRATSICSVVWLAETLHKKSVKDRSKLNGKKASMDSIQIMCNYDKLGGKLSRTYLYFLLRSNAIPAITEPAIPDITMVKPIHPIRIFPYYENKREGKIVKANMRSGDRNVASFGWMNYLNFPIKPRAFSGFQVFCTRPDIELEGDESVPMEWKPIPF